MRVNEAKDVLANEIARQAELEGISLSDLERRMLYFTEEGIARKIRTRWTMDSNPNTTRRNMKLRFRD